MPMLPVRMEVMFTGLISFTQISTWVHILLTANKRKSFSRNELVRVNDN